MTRALSLNESAIRVEIVLFGLLLSLAISLTVFKDHPQFLVSFNYKATRPMRSHNHVSSHSYETCFVLMKLRSS